MLAQRRPTQHPDAKRAVKAIILITLALAGFVRTGGATAAAGQKPVPRGSVAPRCFAETGYCIGPHFSDYWERHGGLAINGYPISDPLLERLEDGQIYTVQYFERVRLEYRPEHAGPNRVVLGELGAALHPADPPVPPPAGPITQDGFYFEQTGHYVPGTFYAYWTAHGGLPQFGYPLSEVISETLGDGNTYQVQYFERARFELHPGNPAPYDVLLGQLGRRILAEMQPRSIAPCAAGNLAVRTTGDAGAGQRYATIALTNTGDGICTLAGVPEVQLRNADDVPLVEVATRATGDAPVDLVVMAPGSTAQFGLRWSNWCGVDPGQAIIRVMLPNNGGQFTTSGIGTPPCLGAGQGSTLDVTPFQLVGNAATVGHDVSEIVAHGIAVIAEPGA